YPLLGLQILTHYAESAVKSVHSRAWNDLNASLLFVDALADMVSEDDAATEPLTALFENIFLGLVNQTGDQIPGRIVPLPSIEQAVTLTAHYATFFERGGQLPSALEFLISSIMTVSVI